MRSCCGRCLTWTRIGWSPCAKAIRDLVWINTSLGWINCWNGGTAGAHRRKSRARRWKNCKRVCSKARWKRAKDIQHWLRQRHEKTLSLNRVDYWLGKLGGVLKVPRKTHPQKQAAQDVEFQRRLCARAKHFFTMPRFGGNGPGRKMFGAVWRSIC